MRKVLNNKTDFDDSRINIEFEDIDITVYINNKEDIATVMENFESVVCLASNRKGNDKDIDIDLKDIDINRK